MVKRRPEDNHPRYTLFLGCTVPVRAVNYELSSRKVAERLGVDLSDIPGFCCCGYPVKSVNHYAYLLMAARNLALAEEKGLPLCTLCSACCGALTDANHEIQGDEKLRNQINEDSSGTKLRVGRHTKILAELRANGGLILVCGEWHVNCKERRRLELTDGPGQRLEQGPPLKTVSPQ